MKKILVAFLFFFTLSTASYGINSSESPEEVLDKATYTFNKFMSHSDKKEFRRLLQKAKGILIVPEYVKAGIILGIEGGDGVLLKRVSETGWGQPLFFRLTSGSIGLQIGGQVSEIAFLIMNEEGIQSILNNDFKLGLDFGVSVGTLGGRIGAGTTTEFDNDIYAFALGEGLYVGAGFEGTEIDLHTEWNERYYSDQDLNAVLSNPQATNPKSTTLMEALAQSPQETTPLTTQPAMSIEQEELK